MWQIQSEFYRLHLMLVKVGILSIHAQRGIKKCTRYHTGCHGATYLHHYAQIIILYSTTSAIPYIQ